MTVRLRECAYIKAHTQQLQHLYCKTNLIGNQQLLSGSLLGSWELYWAKDQLVGRLVIEIFRHASQTSCEISPPSGLGFISKTSTRMWGAALS